MVTSPKFAFFLLESDCGIVYDEFVTFMTLFESVYCF